jgi:hypothetical protein
MDALIARWVYRRHACGGRLTHHSVRKNRSRNERPRRRRIPKDLSSNIMMIYHAFSKDTTAEGEFAHGMDGAYLCRAALSTALHTQLYLYSSPLELWSKSHVVGPFSALNLPQLQLLAERSDTLTGKLVSRDLTSFTWRCCPAAS